MSKITNDGLGTTTLQFGSVPVTDTSHAAVQSLRWLVRPTIDDFATLNDSWNPPTSSASIVTA